MGNTAKPKLAAIYDPYLDTLGGGERYCLTVAEILLANNFCVDLFWSGQPDLLAKAQNRFHLNLDKLRIVSVGQSGLLQKYRTQRQYDLIFHLGDGSIPFLFGRQNLFHVQVPFVREYSLKDKILNLAKVKTVDLIICNSAFTQRFTQKALATAKTTVLYPPVDTDEFNPNLTKEKIILSVGRFDNILNAKKQEVLIEIFKILCRSPRFAWKLILAGGSQQNPDRNDYLLRLKKLALGLPVEFVINPPFAKLVKIYAHSSIYWHAAGYGVDESIHPENTEHFGIAVVEAMASASVPVVVSRGGLVEIINPGRDGFTWQTIEEAAEITGKLINQPLLRRRLASRAVISAQRFSKKKFSRRLLSLIKNK